MQSNLDCGTCKANLCTHTVEHIEQLSLMVADLKRRLDLVNTLLDAVTQKPNIVEPLTSGVVTAKTMTFD